MESRLGGIPSVAPGAAVGGGGPAGQTGLARTGAGDGSIPHLANGALTTVPGRMNWPPRRSL